MAIYYTDNNESDALNGDHDNILDYHDECRKIAATYLSEENQDSIKMVVFDFHRNKSVIFVFEREVRITCTTY